jgi:hypothetical protein
MRALLKFTTIVLILLGGAAGLSVLREEPAPQRVGIEVGEHNSSTSQPRRIETQRQRMSVDAPREVAFVADDLTMAQLTPRERRDQQVDWLLVAALTDAMADVEELNRILADMPLLRHGYLRPLGVLEFGTTRSRYIKDGFVVALIPARVSEMARKDFIAHIADEHRKNQGGAFEAIRPYEYEIDDKSASAKLIRRADIAYSHLMSPTYGYHRAIVSSRPALLSILAKIDDLTELRVVQDGLEIGGRKVLSRAYRSIGIEHIATIWQAQTKLSVIVKEWEKYSDSLVAAFNSRWSGRRYKYESERQALERERDAEWSILRARLTAEARSRRILDHIGFSLDPDFDYQSLATSLGSIEPLVHRLGLYPLWNSLRPARAEAAEGLNKRDIGQFLALERSLREEGGDRRALLGAVLNKIKRDASFQAARYDGDLAGTEVGMILYYTDLLAKLWTLDFEDSAPERQVPEFVTDLSARVSVSYRTEADKLNAARLWFGVSNLGYQKTGGGILFRRNATRIYSAGSDSLQPGKEAETSAAFDASTSWWNDHYEEVEWVEREYQRLNQIMKWSVGLSQIVEGSGDSKLNFLAVEPVRRELWFPEWARSNAALTFKAWDKITFLKKGEKGSITEALPLLVSREFDQFGKKRNVIGGVSLARPREITTRASLPKDFAGVSRRSNVDYSTSRAQSAIKTLEGVTYEFRTAGRVATTTIRANPDVKLRGTYAQVRNAAFVRDIATEGDGIAMSLLLDGKAIGRLGIRPTDNGFRIAWKAQDLETTTALARKLSLERDIPSALKADAEVEAAFALSSEGQYLVKLSEGGDWNLMAIERVPGHTLSTRAHARAGEINGGSSIEITAVDARQAQQMAVGARPIKAEAKRFSDAGEILKTMQGYEARKALSDRFARDLAIVDELVKQGNQARALNRIDDLIDIYGPTPELSLNKAVLLLERRQIDLAGEAARGMTPVPMRNPKSFFDEINARLRQSNLSAVERQNLEAMSDIAAVHHRTASTARDLGQTPQILPYVEKGRIEIGYQVEAGKKGVQLSAHDLAGVDRNALIYVEDSPAFSNIDWSVPLQQAMARPISGARVLRYLDESLALYHPAKVFSADGSRSYRRVREGIRADIAARQAGAQGGRVLSQTDASGGCSDPTNPAQREACIYVIVRDNTGL